MKSFLYLKSNGKINFRKFYGKGGDFGGWGKFKFNLFRKV
jgi:hypothetical protein